MGKEPGQDEAVFRVASSPKNLMAIVEEESLVDMHLTVGDRKFKVPQFLVEASSRLLVQISISGEGETLKISFKIVAVIVAGRAR
ncbi:hypothetical protein [Neomoorella mulderi]|uniref:Uncharacterized protein n=1 Tax=Moorella mulderi DSM 14980 TaxID=1122241 RepID=A0A151AXD0_9FIRM|nr:hypothetical protein [Moorella mulderi]KYH32202.1 hypothetical protein MOMUL_17770 [Moorella mulderi DSM 14980]